MLIGLDFDNTIASYAGVFHAVALEQGFIEPAVVRRLAPDKTSVRDHLRGEGREEDWIRLQGEVYGAQMELARPYPGVAAFFAEAREADTPLVIVSHKTRYSKRGPRYDLHAAARAFLERHGLAGEGTALPFERVFFEPERGLKLARIAEQACSVFVDDLPEVLCDEAFPSDVMPVLFDPEDLQGEVERAGVTRVRSWAQVSDLLCQSPGMRSAPTARRRPSAS